ncbi:MAG: hypothetical protein JWQ66_4684 [Mucilaginibacter sp.]|nr:hypothetical protein [Mucilaginibacter sp.]
MEILSVKNLKKSTRTICEFTGTAAPFGDTTTTVGTDTTTNTITVTTTTHLK